MCNIDEMLDFCVNNYTIKDTLSLLKSVNKDIKYIIINNTLIYSAYTATNSYFNETDKVELYYKNNIEKSKIKVTILHDNKKVRYSFYHYFGDHLEYIGKYVMTRYHLLNYKFNILSILNNETFLIGLTDKLVLNIDGQYKIINKKLKKLKKEYCGYDLICNKTSLFTPNIINSISHGEVVFTERKKDAITLFIIYNYKLYKVIQVLTTFDISDIKNTLSLYDAYNLKFGEKVLSFGDMIENNIKNGSIIHIVD
jgi:hypothetical protein